LIEIQIYLISKLILKKTFFECSSVKVLNDFGGAIRKTTGLRIDGLEIKDWGGSVDDEQDVVGSVFGIGEVGGCGGSVDEFKPKSIQSISDVPKFLLNWLFWFGGEVLKCPEIYFKYVFTKLGDFLKN